MTTADLSTSVEMTKGREVLARCGGQGITTADLSTSVEMTKGREVVARCGGQE
jgi:hypothetical protein